MNIYIGKGTPKVEIYDSTTLIETIEFPIPRRNTIQPILEKHEYENLKNIKKEKVLYQGVSGLLEYPAGTFSESFMQRMIQLEEQINSNYYSDKTLKFYPRQDAKDFYSDLDIVVDTLRFEDDYTFAGLNMTIKYKTYIEKHINRIKSDLLSITYSFNMKGRPEFYIYNNGWTKFIPVNFPRINHFKKCFLRETKQNHNGKPIINSFGYYYKGMIHFPAGTMTQDLIEDLHAIYNRNEFVVLKVRSDLGLYLPIHITKFELDYEDNFVTNQVYCSLEYETDNLKNVVRYSGSEYSFAYEQIRIGSGDTYNDYEPISNLSEQSISDYKGTMWRDIFVVNQFNVLTM